MKQVLSILIALVLSIGIMSAQDTTRVWTMNDCLNYALEHNIQIRQVKNNYNSGLETTEQAKQALLPSLSGSINQNFTNYPSSEVSENNSYTGSYGVNANVTLFQGRRLVNSLKLSKLQNSIDALSVSTSENSIRISVIQAYIQCLYAKESIVLAQKSVETSKAQCDRGEQLWRAGSISKVAYSQLETQLASDRYQVVNAEKNYANYLLQLKQLLELGVNDEIQVVAPNITETDVMSGIASKEAIYNASLGVMPEIEQSRLGVESSKLNEKIAVAGYYPTISLGASVGTGHSSGPYSASGMQVWNRFNESVGLSISIPIYSNRSNLTEKNQSKIATLNSELELLSSEKQLLSEVEELYLGVTTNQSQYAAAMEQLTYTEQNFNLVTEQFQLGVKNTIELLTAQNDYFASEIEVLQSKYMVVMSKELLNIYQGKAINSAY